MRFNPMIRTIPFPTFMALLMVFAMASCAPDALIGGDTSREPMLIALRNSSGQNLESMTVQESNKSVGESVRLGSISPVMKDRTYTFMRPENPPRLPNEATVVYAHRQFGTQQVSVRLREALRDCQGVPYEALVFDLQRTGEVRVYLDQVAP